MYIDKFGYLSFTETIHLPCGKVSSLDIYSDAENYINEYKHRDGFLYPPIVQQHKLDSSYEKSLGVIPNTERPAVLFKVPISHSIELNLTGDKKEIRSGVGGLFVYLLYFN